MPGRSYEQFLSDPEFAAAIFFPRKFRNDPPPNARDYDIPVEDTTSLGARWYLADPAWPTVFAFHGNGEIVSDYDAIAPYYHRIRLNLFMVDYRGYGWSDGKPTPRNLRSDAIPAAEFFLNELAQLGAADSGAPRPILFGRSLGSGPAALLAREMSERFSSLILESGFSDVRHLLRLFQIDAGEHEQRLYTEFSNHLKLKELQLPVLIIHGASDYLLPPEQAEENFEAVPHDRKRKCILDAGHNDILMHVDKYFDAVAGFVDEYDLR